MVDNVELVSHVHFEDVVACDASPEDLSGRLDMIADSTQT